MTRLHLERCAMPIALLSVLCTFTLTQAACGGGSDAAPSGSSSTPPASGASGTSSGSPSSSGASSQASGSGTSGSVQSSGATGSTGSNAADFDAGSGTPTDDANNDFDSGDISSANDATSGNPPTDGDAGSNGSADSGPAPGGGSGTDHVTPTAANRAMCKSVPITTSIGGAMVCPGGGAGPNCFECLFGGATYNSTDVATAQGTQEAGNYAVTVQLGGSAAGVTQIDAEANRVLLGATSTPANASQTFQFMVNVRAKEGQPDENVAAGYPGLDLYFSGPSATPPQVSAIGYELASTAGDKPVMVYIGSDSTTCDQTDTDYAGWGQMLPQYFDYPVDIANYADSGESSGSFLNGSDRWGAIDGALAAGDWVLLQFGHNDGSTPSATFQANMTKMVTAAKAKGATPVLVSPPARAVFSGSTLSDQGSLHAADTQAVAKAQNVAYIDLTSISTAWYNQIGPTGWQAYHALGKDKTHTNAAGATKIASLVASAIGTQNIGLAPYLRK